MPLPDELIEECLEQVGGAIALADDVGTILLANRAWQGLARAEGACPAAETVPVVIRRVFAADANREEIEAGVGRVLAGDRTSFAFNTDPDAPEPGRRGRCMSVLANERRWTVVCLDAQPDRTASAAAPARQPLGRSGTEHEIRNSLNAVIGFAQLLTSGVAGPLNEKQRQYAELILRQGQQALEHVTAWMAAKK